MQFEYCTSKAVFEASCNVTMAWIALAFHTWTYTMRLPRGADPSVWKDLSLCLKKCHTMKHFIARYVLECLHFSQKVLLFLFPELESSKIKPFPAASSKLIPLALKELVSVLTPDDDDDVKTDVKKSVYTLDLRPAQVQQLVQRITVFLCIFYCRYLSNGQKKLW